MLTTTSLSVNVHNGYEPTPHSSAQLFYNVPRCFPLTISLVLTRNNCFPSDMAAVPSDMPNVASDMAAGVVNADENS